MRRILPLLFLLLGCGGKADVTIPPGPESDPRGLSLAQLQASVVAQDSLLLQQAKETLGPAGLTRRAREFNKAAQVRELQQVAFRAAVSIRAMEESALGLERRLRHLDRAYRALGESFREKALDYDQSAHRELLLGWGAYYDDLRARIPRHRERLEQLKREMPEAARLIREMNHLVDDYANLVSSLNSEDALVPDAVCAGFMEALAESNRKLNRWRDGLATYERGKE